MAALIPPLYRPIYSIAEEDFLRCLSGAAVLRWSYSVTRRPERSSLRLPCLERNNHRNFTNLRNIRSPDVVSAHGRSYDVRIVRPESEWRG